MGKHRSETEIRVLARRTKVAALMLKGITVQVEIAKQLGMEPSQQPTIARDMKWVKEKWKRSAVRDFDKARAEQAERLLYIYSEAMAAWERSKVEKQTTRTKRRTHGEGAGTTDEAEVKKEFRDGDKRYLDAAMAALAQIEKLYGFGAATKIAHGGDPNAPPIKTETVIRIDPKTLATDELRLLLDLRRRFAGAASAGDSGGHAAERN